MTSVDLTEGARAKERVKALFEDKRTYQQRLLLSAAAVFCFCFTFLFFGPFDITASNAKSMVIQLDDAALVGGVCALAVFAVAAPLLSLVRGKLFDYLVTAVFSLTLCGYMQSLALNGNIGALTGDQIAWHKMTTSMVIDLMLWFAVFLIPYLVLYISRKRWKGMLLLLTSALVLMQCAGVVGALAAQSPSEARDAYATVRDIYDFSASDNTLVFLLDHCDYLYIEEVLADDPSFFEELDGFTAYTNAISEFARTRPGANFVLTGCEENVYVKEATAFFRDSWGWGDRQILKDIASAGYTIDVYGEARDLFGTPELFLDEVSNLAPSIEKPRYRVIGKRLFALAAYRYVPTVMKPFFWMYTDDVNKNTYTYNSALGDRYVSDDAAFGEGIGSMSINDGRKYFKFYHLMGSHPPWTLNADGTRNMDGFTDAMSATKGSFQILYNLFAEMKLRGIYQDATILILSDHGATGNDDSPLQRAARIGMFYKPAGSEGDPLVYSSAPVSNSNIPALILKSIGSDYSAYGTPLDEVAEDAEITRHFYKSVIRGTDKSVYYYEIVGDAADFSNWNNTRIFEDTADFY